MLDVIGNLNSLDLPLSFILVSLDIINMVSNIDDNLRLSSVKKYLDLCSKNIPPANCLLEALEQTIIEAKVQFSHSGKLPIQSQQ